MNDRREKGLYWDRAWKLVDGCSKVSPGCDNCWSEAETAMRSEHPHIGVAGRSASVFERDGTFSGRILLRDDNLDLPLRAKKPTVFAVWNDLYHENVPDDFRDRAYAVMALCPQHVFLVLTKRAQRMAGYWHGPRYGLIDQCAFEAQSVVKDARKWPGVNLQLALDNWIWHGVTAENQEMADHRIPHLLRVPGRRFLSIEPMLGPVDLMNLNGPGYCRYQCLHPIVRDDDSARGSLHAVLLGGESGKNARPMHRDWVRSVRDQCAAADVPFFFKQGYGFRPEKLPLFDGRTHDCLPWGAL